MTAAFVTVGSSAGHVFDAQLVADTDIYRVSYEVTPVPELETYALMLSGLELIGLVESGFAGQQRIR